MCLLHEKNILQLVEVIKLVDAVPWPPSQRQMVMDALNDAVGRSVGPPKINRRKEQDYTTLIDFLPQRSWNALTDSASSPQCKRDVIIQAMLALNCINPSAHTLRLATSVLLYCSFGFNDTMSMSQAQKGAHGDELKTQCKRMARMASKTQCSFKSEHYLTKLPGRPADLKSNYPCIYDIIYTGHAGAPISPPIEMMCIMRIDTSFACRGNGTVTVPHHLVPNSAESMMTMMMKMFKGMESMQCMQDRRNNDVNIPIGYAHENRQENPNKNEPVRALLGLGSPQGLLARPPRQLEQPKRAQTMDVCVHTAAPRSIADIPQAASKPDIRQHIVETSAPAYDVVPAQNISDDQGTPKTCSTIAATQSPSLRLLDALRYPKKRAHEVAEPAPRKRLRGKQPATESLRGKHPATEKHAVHKIKGISVEYSRNNVQARTGKMGPGQNKGFRYGPGTLYADVDAAVVAAKEWLGLA